MHMHDLTKPEDYRECYLKLRQQSVLLVQLSCLDVHVQYI